MIPADIDPSLRTGEPTPDRLDDGFSPPAPDHAEAGARDATVRPHAPETALAAKSPF